MSELLDKIKSRRSIRKFKSDAVPEDILDKIIEAGTYAATGMNKQSPIIVAVTNRETRDKLSRVNCKIGGWNEDFDPFYGAPALHYRIGGQKLRKRYLRRLACDGKSYACRTRPRYRQLLGA